MRCSILTIAALLHAFFSSPSSMAAPPRAPAPARTDEDQNAIEASDNYNKADEELGRGEHAAAIASYKRGIERAGLISDPGVRGEALRLGRISLAQAHRVAYDVGGGREHVDEVARLLAEYADDSPEPNPDVDALAAWVDANRQEPPRRGARPSVSTESPSPVPTARRRLVIAGAAVTGVGGGLSVAFFFMIKLNADARRFSEDAENENPRNTEREQAYDNVTNTSSKAAIASGVLAGAAIVTGVALIIVGKRSRKRDSVAAGGFPLMRGAGVGFAGRF